MDLGADLSAEALAEAMPGRPMRTYQALISTEADALAWARAGAPDGAVVVANHQTSPRGRAGTPWRTFPGQGLGFSLILRPELPPHREGWLYTVAASGVADALGEGATIAWPDEVRADGDHAGAVAVRSSAGVTAFEWVVINVLVPEAAPPRAPLLRGIVEAIEARQRSSSEAVLADYLPRCETIGRPLRVRLMGAGHQRVEGRAVDARDDGALVLETAPEKRGGVRPGDVYRIEAEPAAEDSGA